jgi:hypothetical protein
MSADKIRGLLERATASHWINVLTEGDRWSTASVAAGPFPARIRIDESGQRLHHEVVVAELAERVELDEVARAVPMPPPDISLELATRRVVIAYSLDFAEASEESLVGLLGAGPLFATAFAMGLFDAMTDAWKQRLAAHGFGALNGFGRDPRSLLQEPNVAAWPDE